MFGDKIKNWQGLQIDRFLITLCTEKYFFSTAKGPPHKLWRSMGNGLGWASADSIYFGKLGCKRAYIEYGGDTGFHQRKGRSPFSNHIQESKIVG